jgi:hypothetical protein
MQSNPCFGRDFILEICEKFAERPRIEASRDLATETEHLICEVKSAILEKCVDWIYLTSLRSLRITILAREYDGRGHQHDRHSSVLVGFSEESNVGRMIINIRTNERNIQKWISMRDFLARSSSRDSPGNPRGTLEERRTAQN